MTLDDIPDLMEPTTAATGTGAMKRCRRHEWNGYDARDDEDFMCPNCVTPWKCNGPHLSVWSACRRCGAVRDDDAAKRNRRNRQRGSSFERTVAQKLGGRRTGPLGGRDDILVGEMFAVQTKKDTRLSLNVARQYHRDLQRTFPTRGPLVVHANPGHNPEPVVIVPLSVWIEHFGTDGMRDDE